MAEKAKEKAVKPAAKKPRKRTPKVEAPALEVQETAEATNPQAAEKPKENLLLRN